MARSETATRVLVAALGIPLALVAVYFGGWVLAVPLAALAALGAVEYFRLAARKESRPLVLVGAAIAALLVLLSALNPHGAAAAGFGELLVVSALAVTAIVIWTNGVEAQPLVSAATTVFGALYTGGLLAYGIFLRHLPGVESAWHGTAIVLTPLLLTWVSDTSAYFVGRRFGTRKLIPRVSPGKTVQGAAGAVVGGVLVGALYAEFVLGQFGVHSIGWPAGAALGLLVSIAAQVGDLAESLLKRDAGVKDSGTLFPGHGGVLDRLDSLLFTLPIAYLFFHDWSGLTAAVQTLP